MQNVFNEMNKSDRIWFVIIREDEETMRTVSLN